MEIKRSKFTRTKPPGELLSEAAARGDHLRVAQLLAEGAPIDWVEGGPIRGGQTALHRARSPLIVRLLLEAGADAVARDHYGYTPLHYAYDVDAIRILMSAGADVNARSKEGYTLLHHVLRGEDLVDGHQIEPLLELPGIDMNVRDGCGCTPIWFALQQDERRVNPDDQVLAKLLARAGADLDDEGALEYRLAHPPVEFKEQEDEDSESRAWRWDRWKAARSNPDPWHHYPTPREYARNRNFDASTVEELERIANSHKTARLLESAFSCDGPAHDGASRTDLTL